MNNRRKLVIVLGASALAAPFPSIGQQLAGIPRIGLLGLGSGEDSIGRAFREALGERGYVEGKNILIEDRSTVELYEQLPRAAQELADLKVNMIVTAGNTATLAAGKITSTIPIVIALAAFDPVKLGLASGLAHPSRNVTGIISFQDELVVKRIELLKEMLPGLKRLAILMSPGSSEQPAMLERAEVTARALQLQIYVAEARTPNAIGAAIAGAAKAHAGALMGLPSTMLNAHMNEMASAAVTNRLPAIFQRSAFVEVGGLIAYGTNAAEIMRRVATYVDKILKGAKPGELPIEQPMTFELAINMRTAKALGIAIPPSILVRATKVVE